MKRPATIKTYSFCTLAAILILIAISTVQMRLRDIAEEEKFTDEPLRNAPPLIAFTTKALGSFRGLLADLLWVKTIGLQDEGKYFEMVQLASWITKLQPRFTGATAYLAWNMAYNISVTCSEWEDRWRWVKKGIELIRDEAILYNDDPKLYKELGWIYQHKLGDIMDDAHFYYKTRLANELLKVFGSADPNWEKIAEAPKSIEILKMEIQNYPGLEKKIKSAGYDTLEKLFKAFKIDGKIPEKISDSVNDKNSLKTLEYFFRSKWIREEYKLQPEKIIEINQKYGELDWRLPESQAIYWASMGLENADEKLDVDCNRMIAQALKTTFQKGKILLANNDTYRMITVPNLDVVDAVKKVHEKAYEKHKNSSFRDGLTNFIIDAVVSLYTFGNYSKAQEYYEILRKRKPNDNKIQTMGIDEFVLDAFGEDINYAGPKQANTLINGLIYRSLYFLAYGDKKARNSHIRLAQFIYKRYEKENSGDVKGRFGLAPFGEMEKKMIEVCMKNWPPFMRKSLKKQLEFEKGQNKSDSDEADESEN